jgi:hypothetical protein
MSDETWDAVCDSSQDTSSLRSPGSGCYGRTERMSHGYRHSCDDMKVEHIIYTLPRVYDLYTSSQYAHFRSRSSLISRRVRPRVRAIKTPNCVSCQGAGRPLRVRSNIVRMLYSRDYGCLSSTTTTTTQAANLLPVSAAVTIGGPCKTKST